MSSKNEWANNLKEGDTVIILSGCKNISQIERRVREVQKRIGNTVWVVGLGVDVTTLFYDTGIHWWRLAEPTEDLIDEVNKEEIHRIALWKVGSGIRAIHNSWEVTGYDIPTDKLEQLNSRVSEIREILFELNGEVFED